MKKLYLVRHAEPERNGLIEDKQRKLTELGELQAQRLGKILSELAELPSIFLCSDAVRTRQTLEKIITNFKHKYEIIYEPKLYYGSPTDFLEIISQVSEEHNKVMVISHNPTISILANMLFGGGDDDFASEVQVGFTPATIINYEFCINNWQEIMFSKGKILWVHRE